VVIVNRSNLERKLSIITSALRSNSNFPLLGANIGGQLTFWQDSYMPIWDGIDSKGEDEFTFSVDSTVFRNIVNGFKTEDIDIGINAKKAVVVKSNQSKVIVPYLDGPYDEIPEKPLMQISCTVERDFLSALMKSKDFVSKTYENIGLTYSYLGHRGGQFFISGAGSIYQYATSVPFSGETLPEIIMPPEYAAVVGRLFSNTTLQVGLSDRQQIIMMDGPTLISTRTVNATYPNTVYALADADGELLFVANKQKLLESLRLAVQTTKENMVGLSSIQDSDLTGLDVYIPNAVIEAELFVEAEIINYFPCTYFSLPFLIKCISTFEGDTIYVERLNQFNGAFRIGTGTEEITVLQPIRYNEPG